MPAGLFPCQRERADFRIGLVPLRNKGNAVMRTLSLIEIAIFLTLIVSGVALLA